MNLKVEAVLVLTARAYKWIPEAFQIFKKDGFGFFLLCLLSWLASGLMSAIPMVGPVIAFLFSSVIQAGVYFALMKHEETQKIDFSFLLIGFKQKFQELMTLSLLSIGFVVVGIIVGVGIYFLFQDELLVAITVGALALIGVVFYYIVAFFFAAPLVLLKGISPAEALKLSADACMKNWWPLTIYSLLSLMWTLLAAIPLGLGLLILIPTLQIASYLIFKDLFKEVKVKDLETVG